MCGLGVGIFNLPALAIKVGEGELVLQLLGHAFHGRQELCPEF